MASKHGYDRHAGTMGCETPSQGDAVEIRLERCLLYTSDAADE